MKMKVRAYTILLAALFLAAAVSVQAQEQGPSSGGMQAGGAQGAAVVPASTVDTQGIRRYLLGPGDTLDVRVFGQPDLNWQGEVEADGNITSLPFIDTPVRAQCRTDKEIQKDIIAAYSKFLRSPQISVRVTGRNSRSPATIYGAVAAPSRIMMMRPVRLNELIVQSGGITERANGDIQILHMEPVMCPEPGEVVEPLEKDGVLSASTLKVYKWEDLKLGKPEANPLIRPGDIVTVMESKPVYITGSVASPQPVLLKEGYNTLSRVLFMVGGVTPAAKSTDVRIYRSKPGVTDMEVTHVDYDAIKKRKKEDIVLQPYDIIEVPKASDWSFTKLMQGLGKSVLGGATSLPTYALQYKVIY